MSEAVYGDCRDTCIAYMIESEYACMRCAEEMDMAQEQEDEDCFLEIYDQGA